VILPPWCRKSPKVAEVLPLLYLHGLSTGDFAPALEGFFGSAAGLSAAAIGRLLGAWQADDQAFVSVIWPSGTTCTSGLMDSTSGCGWSRPTCAVWCWWACVPTAPRNWSPSPTGTRVDRVVGRAAAGSAATRDAGAGGRGRDGALGLWAALRDVFPATRQQRDWVHKLANVLNALPKAVQAGARKALAEIRDAPDREHAERAIEAFAADYGVKWPKAVAKVVDDAEALLCFFDFPGSYVKPPPDWPGQ
jgi:putative transposase